MPTDTGPKIEIVNQSIQKSLADYGITKSNSDMEQSRNKSRQLLATLTVQEMPILSVLDQQGKDVAPYIYSMKRASAGFYEVPMSWSVGPHDCHILADKSDGLEIDLNMVSEYPINHAYGTEMEKIVSPTTAPDLGGITLYLTGIQDIENANLEADANVRAAEIENEIFLATQPFREAFGRIDLSRPNGLKEACNLVKDATEVFYKNPHFVAEHKRLVAELAYRTGSVPGGVLGLALALQKDSNLSTQNAMTTYRLCSDSVGRVFAQAAVNQYVENITRNSLNSSFALFDLLFFPLKMVFLIFWSFLIDPILQNFSQILRSALLEKKIFVVFFLLNLFCLFSIFVLV